MQLDVNADLGEGYSAWSMGDDAALLDIVTSANIACGFHAGDPVVMARTLAAAVERKVTIGAHVSYQDRAGFGRVPMAVPGPRLHAEVNYQIAALSGMARIAGGTVRYVKPHGALYHAILRDQEQAEAVVAAAAEHELTLLTQPGLAADVADQRGVPVAFELFADRAYTSAGTLVPRSEPGAVLDDVQQIVARIQQFMATGTMPTLDGDPVHVPARTVCVHGDTPDSVAIARAVAETLAAGGGLAPFAP